nr:MAG TPA: hypothetical protein [Caudoviricetes sp.]
MSCWLVVFSYELILVQIHELPSVTQQTID